MEKDLFPSRGSDGESLRDLPPVFPSPMPRMDAAPQGGCGGCGSGGGQERGHVHDGGGHGCHDHSHGHEEGCHRGCVGHEGCGADSWGLGEYPLAMVYAPCQVYRALYDPATALNRGTLFTELDLPLGGMDGGAFVTEGCSCRAERRRV